MHDWELWKNFTTGNKNIDWPDENQFLATKLLGGYSTFVLSDLVNWMADPPDTVIITDTKDDFGDFAESFFSGSVDYWNFIIGSDHQTGSLFREHCLSC